MTNLFSQSFAISSDHGGFALKESLVDYLNKKGATNFQVLGAMGTERMDFPPITKEMAELIQAKKIDWGILICGTGIGTSIAANRFKGVHCALCHDVTTARLARSHNNANILSLGGRMIGSILAQEIVVAFAETAYLDDRYETRRQMMDRADFC